MTDVFGQHRPKIPYQPIAELLAQYARRDPDKLAIVDLEQETSISFGALERGGHRHRRRAQATRASARAAGCCCCPTRTSRSF